MKLKIDDICETNELLTTVLDNINSAIFLVDKKARIRNINNAGAMIFSKPAVAMKGELYGNAIGCINPYFYKADCGTTPKCQHCGLRNSIISSFTNNTPTEKALLKRTFVVDDIEILKTFLYSTRIIKAAGNDQVLIIMDNVSEIENQKELLVELNEEKNRFLGIAAHDLRSPIATIQMYAKAFLDLNQDLLTHDQLKMVQIIHKKSCYMLSLLENLLDISRIESGIHDLHLKMVDTVSFVDNIIANNQLLAKKKDMTITLITTLSKVFLFIDEIKLEQVITNLIQNAIKYSYRGSRIIVQLSMEKANVKIEFIDRGIGVPIEKQNDLYKPFLPLVSQGTEGEKSFGLGLSIVKKIIEAHGGSVGIVSELGQGSNFYFLLPVSLIQS